MKKLLLLLLCIPFFSFGQTIIYSTGGDREIIQTDINGNSPTVLYTASSNANVQTLKIDNINNKVYWNEHNSQTGSFSKLMRSDINSFAPELVLIVSTNQMTDIEILKDTNLIYWRTDDDDIYNNANGLENLIITGQNNNCYSFCIDEPNGHIYLTGWNGAGTLWRTNLDGSNIVNLSSGMPSDTDCMFFDDINQRIYYWSGSEIWYYDVATDSHHFIFNPPTGGTSQLTAYDLSSNNPVIVWASPGPGAIVRVNFDGTAYQSLILDNNTYGIDIQESTTLTGVTHDLPASIMSSPSSKRIMYSTDHGKQIIQTDLNGNSPTVLYM